MNPYVGIIQIRFYGSKFNFLSASPFGQAPLYVFSVSYHIGKICAIPVFRKYQNSSADYFIVFMNSVISRSNLGAIALPASITSCSFGSLFERSAAMFVMHDTPQTLMPAWRAAIVSTTVLMPTASAPSIRSAFNSAEDSYEGPESWT